MTRLHFGGEAFLALAEGALLWPARQALIVADLHLEKASWFARRGQMLPPYDSDATLSLLEQLIGRHAVQEVWALGDSFHDAEGAGRLSPGERARLASLTTLTRWTWIAGNHDGLGAGVAGGRVADEACVDGIILRHRADPQERAPELSGHFHPKWRVGGRGRTVSRRCFVQGPNRLILPAFGTLTGGLHAGAEPIRALAGPGAQALVPMRERLLGFPL